MGVILPPNPLFCPPTQILTELTQALLWLFLNLFSSTEAIKYHKKFHHVLFHFHFRKVVNIWKSAISWLMYMIHQSFSVLPHIFEVFEWVLWRTILAKFWLMALEVYECSKPTAISIYHTMHFYFRFQLFSEVENVEKCTVSVGVRDTATIFGFIAYFRCLPIGNWWRHCT
jgi:hypothetical protein